MVKIIKISTLQNKGSHGSCSGLTSETQFRTLTPFATWGHRSVSPIRLPCFIPPFQAWQSWLYGTLSSCWCSADQMKAKREGKDSDGRDELTREQKAERGLGWLMLGFQQSPVSVATGYSSFICSVRGVGGHGPQDRAVNSNVWGLNHASFSTAHSVGRILSLTPSRRYQWQNSLSSLFHTHPPPISYSSQSSALISGRVHATFLLFTRQSKISVD